MELARIDNKTALHVALLFENTRLARYPLPQYCTHDQGGEFTGWAFQQMLRRHGIHGRCAASKNPQANAICERMHQSVGNQLRAMASMEPPDGVQDANLLVDTALANCLFATRAAVHGTLKASPGSLAFSRDMILNIPIIADWELLRQKRQQLVNSRLIRANQKRFSYDYRVGDWVLKLTYKPKKLQERSIGPYQIEQVHANGTVTIRISPHVTERINLRRIKPYRQPNP